MCISELFAVKILATGIHSWYAVIWNTPTATLHTHQASNTIDWTLGPARPHQKIYMFVLQSGKNESCNTDFIEMYNPSANMDSY